MGSWSVSCGISNIAITDGQECVILPLKESNRYVTAGWQAATLPIFGKYNDYGGMEHIVEDDNTKYIEKYLGISIEEFVEFLVDGKFTYNRSEVKPIIEKLEKNGTLAEVAEMRFMWIDKRVYDFMIVDLNEYDRGYNDFGTPEMLKELGFKQIHGAKCTNYDSKRFNQLWRNKDDVEFYSDGRTLLTTEKQKKENQNRFVYHFGRGNESSLETYCKVPNKMEYLKTMTKSEAWRAMSKREAQEHLSPALASSSYEFDGLQFGLEELMKKLSSKLPAEELAKFESKKPKAKLHREYYDKLDQYGDRLAQMIALIRNLHPMSGRLQPHVLYLTPQCGERAMHQKLLNKFAQINNDLKHENGGELEDLFDETQAEFILGAVNAYWNDANTNLQRKDLGDIERKNYEYQLNESKKIIDQLQEFA